MAGAFIAFSNYFRPALILAATSAACSALYLFARPETVKSSMKPSKCRDERPEEQKIHDAEKGVTQIKLVRT